MFAVLNENVGLMDDLLLMSEQGTPVDETRLRSLTRSMGHQIQRGDSIVDKMNRFAHEVDQPIRRIDLNETMSLVVALSERLAGKHGVKIDAVCEQEISITTNPFFLENLLWGVIDFAMDAGKTKTLTILSEKCGPGIRIRFSGLENLEPADSKLFQSENTQALLESLAAELSFDLTAGEIIITLPEMHAT